jgi:hypothetical protein
MFVISKKKARTLGKKTIPRQKNIFPCVGRKPARWQPKLPPPPQSARSKVAGLPCGDPPTPAKTCQHPPTPTTTPHLSRDRGRGKKGKKCSLIKDYFKKLISHNRRAKLAPSLLQCQSSPISCLRAVRRENVSYIVTRANKRPAKTIRLSQSASQHSTGNISAESSENKKKAGHNSTCGIVSSLLFLPLKILLHTVYIFNIFMWTETPIGKEAYR